jgi:site-specific recombinase XerD
MQTLDQTHVAAFLVHLRGRDLARHTPRDYHHQAKAYVSWLAGRLPDLEQLRAYRQWMQVGREHPLRPRSIRAAFTSIRAFYAYLRESDAAAFGDLPSPKDVKMPPLDDALRNIPDDVDVAAMFRAGECCPTTTAAKRFRRARDLALLSVLCHGGLRRREALDLQLNDVLMGDERWYLRIRQGKGGTSDRQPLNATTVRLLTEYLAVREGWIQTHAYTGVGLWPVDRRRDLSDRGLTDLLRELSARAGIDPRKYTAHCYRHWFGTTVMQETDPKTAQKLLRHRNFSTTAEIYLHTNEERKLAGVDAIAGRAINISTERKRAGEYTGTRGTPGRTTRQLKRRPSRTESR